MSEDNILLHLRRKYNKEEELRFIFDQLSQAKMEVGMLKSENEELRDKVNKLEGKIWNDKECRRREGEKRNKKRPWLDGMSVSDLWSKYLSLMKKYEKLQSGESVPSLDTTGEIQTESKKEDIGIYTELVLGSR